MTNKQAQREDKGQTTKDKGKRLNGDERQARANPTRNKVKD